MNHLAQAEGILWKKTQHKIWTCVSFTDSVPTVTVR